MVQTDEERKAKQKEYKDEYNSRPEIKAKEKEYRDSPEGKAKQKEYNQSPEGKARKREYEKKNRKKYQSTPENLAKRREYDQRPERKARRKKYLQRPEVKANTIAMSKKYYTRPEIKAKAKKYDQRPERKARRKKYLQRPEIKAKAKEYRNTNRFKVLQHYSKTLSNSDIPCCNCCGLDEHMDFLALDHIAGKKQMDSEPELIKLGYSSKLRDLNLLNWIIKNNFPNGFQALCNNCNSAKGMKKNNNKCPHETMEWNGQFDGTTAKQF